MATRELVLGITFLAAVFGSAFAFGEAEAAVSDGECRVGDGVERRFSRGGSSSRMCAVDALEEFRFGEATPAFPAVRAKARVLADYYAARSERQQLFEDTGAFFTGAGVLGYGFSAPAGASTQAWWGYGALLPIILVQFNANEPTRDLFFAGRIGADLVSDRYAVLDRALTMLKALDGRQSGYNAACDDVEAKLTEIEGWSVPDDKAALLPVAISVADRCRTLRSGWAALGNLTAVADVWKSHWPREYATDLVRLDDRLLERDSRLRTSPTEALTMLVSTSLRTLDTLVSGENAQAAIDAMKVQEALSGMSMGLAEVRLPSAPATIDTPLTLSAAADARAAMTRPAVRRGQPAGPDVPGQVRWMREKVRLLEEARAVHNERVLWASQLASAAATNQLEFAYLATSRQIEVVLRAPGGHLPHDPPAAARAAPAPAAP